MAEWSRTEGNSASSLQDGGSAWWGWGPVVRRRTDLGKDTGDFRGIGHVSGGYMFIFFPFHHYAFNSADMVCMLLL